MKSYRIYSSVLRGYLNYYSFVDNFSKLGWIQYTLTFSCIKTLASKHRIDSARKTFRRYGNPPKVTIPREGKPPLIVEMYKQTNWKATPSRFLISGEEPGPDGIVALRIRAKRAVKLGQHCVICGETEDVEMHHLRHVRKMGSKVKGFSRLMATINRKLNPPVQATSRRRTHREIRRYRPIQSL